MLERTLCGRAYRNTVIHIPWTHQSLFVNGVIALVPLSMYKLLMWYFLRVRFLFATAVIIYLVPVQNTAMYPTFEWGGIEIYVYPRFRILPCKANKILHEVKGWY